MDNTNKKYLRFIFKITIAQYALVMCAYFVREPANFLTDAHVLQSSVSVLFGVAEVWRDITAFMQICSGTFILIRPIGFSRPLLYVAAGYLGSVPLTERALDCNVTCFLRGSE